jgi:LmbE family N-acetylglucosaminyl deacetylase
MILALSPHTDDTDLGCSGYIQQHKHNNRIKVIAFSDCGNPETALEFYNAQDVIGVDECKVLNFRRRTFHENRQEILDHILTYDPDVVLVPSTSDCHQDHQVITQEAIRAFKHRTILGYYLPWNNVLNYAPNAFCELFSDQVETKVESLACYKTQAKRPYMSEEAIVSSLVVNGLISGVKYAEAFEVIRYNL